MQFSAHPESQEAAIGDQVTLECPLASPDASVALKWLKDEEISLPIPQATNGSSSNTSADLLVGIDVNGDTLTIDSFEASHAGSYRCLAVSTTSSGDGNQTLKQVSHEALLSYFSQ